MQSISRSVLASLVVCLAFQVLGQTQSASNLPDLALELIVSAEKREEAVEDVPLSIQVLPERFLQRFNIDNVTQASQYVPNLFLSEFSARRTSFPFIRGIGSGLGEPAVTTYVDGVPQLSPSSTNLELLDLARIEVLRGPQGSLYGRNTLGGLIHYISNQPTDALRYRVGADLGQDSRQRFKAGISGHLGGNWYGSLQALSFTQDGFTTNTFNDQTVDDRESFAGRAKLLYAPNDSFSLAIQYHGERNDDGGFTLFDLNSTRNMPHRLTNDFIGKTERDITSPSVTMNYAFNNLNLEAVVSQQDWDGTDISDLDFSATDLLRRSVREEQEQRYAEFRLSSNQQTMGTVSYRWLAGLTWFDSTFDHDSENEFRPTLVQLPFSLKETATYQLNDDGKALFGQIDFEFSQRFSIGLGARYLEEDKQTNVSLSSQVIPEPLNQTTTAFENDFDAFLPRVNFSFHPQEDHLIYASAAKGYRSGGYNRNTTTTGPFKFNEEESWTYELGYKTALLENRLILSGALFKIDWDDRQLEVADPFLPGRFFLDNVGESESVGFEIDVKAVITRQWFVMGGLGVTDSEFKSYQDPFSSSDITGNQLPNAPQDTWHLAVQYEQDQNGQSGWFATGDINGAGRMYFDNQNTVSQASFQRVNLRVGYALKGFTFEVWGRNVLDEEYVPLAIPSNFSPSGYVGRPGDPSQLGVTLGYRY